MASIIICVLTTTRKKSVVTPRKNTFQWTLSRTTLVQCQDFQLCIREKTWMLSLPTKSEDDFSVTDGIISLIYIHRCLRLPNLICSVICILDTREHCRGTKWRKANERVGPPATHKHSCRKLCLQLSVITLTENNSSKQESSVFWYCIAVQKQRADQSSGLHCRLCGQTVRNQPELLPLLDAAGRDLKVR